MKLNKFIPDFGTRKSPLVEKIKTEKKLEGFLDGQLAGREDWESFLGTVDNVSGEELLQFAKEVNESFGKQTQRKEAKKSIPKVIKEAIFVHSYEPIGPVIDHIIRGFTSKITTKLEKEKRYLSFGDDSFAVVTPNNKEVIIGEVTAIEGLPLFVKPKVTDKIPVTGEFHGLNYKDGQVFIE